MKKSCVIYATWADQILNLPDDYPVHDFYRIGKAPTATVEDGEIIDLGGRKLEVLHTPGHTPGSVCLFKADATDDGRGILISGDTLFDYGGYGRTDMYGGDELEIQKSLARLQRDIPAGTLVYPGHDSFGFSFSSVGFTRCTLLADIT